MPRRSKPSFKKALKNTGLFLLKNINPLLLVVALFFFSSTLYLLDQDRALQDELAVAQTSIKKYQDSTGGAQDASASTIADAPGAVQPVRDSDHVLGNRNAPVLLIEYSDYECPFCKAFQPTLQQVMKDFGDKVALVYRQFPLSFHQNAEKEAEAGECVASLGGNDDFWKFTDTIFQRTTSNGTGFALANLPALAQEVGVDPQAFSQCLDSGKFAASVAASEKEGQDSGVKGTPATFIVGRKGTPQLIPGAFPVDQVEKAINTMLQ